MSKSQYSISVIDKNQCASILLKWHYLRDISKGFKSGKNYGLFKGEDLVGVCIFTGFPVPELVKGMYGLERSDQKGFYELSRLCLGPKVQKNEHNLASWFLSRSIKELRNSVDVRSILSYADDDHHKGVTYAASNFKYYGLTTRKKDYWLLQDDGSHIKHSRGKTRGVLGEWRPRSRKHRFVMEYDKNLDIRWVSQKWENTHTES